MQKKQTKTFNENYNQQVQRVILDMLLSDPTGFVICRNILREEYFDDNLRPAVRYILEYADEYKVLPAIEQVKAKTGVKVEKFSEGSVHTDYLLKETEGFCRYKALELAILEGAELLEAGRGGEIESKIKDAMTISLMSDLGTSYFEDPEARLKRIADKSGYVSTGWKTLDHKLFGGFTRGGLNIFCGSSGCVVAGTKIQIKNAYDDKFRYVSIENLSLINDGVKYLCNSPDGWVSIEQWRNKGKKETYEARLENGCRVIASDDHLFQLSSGEWRLNKDLKVGDLLITDSGPSPIVRHKTKGLKTVYDLAIGHSNHRYYTNGICSHNSGKSLFLQNLAINWSMVGYVVIYISLELSEELISMRLDAMITEKGTSHVMRNIDETVINIRNTQRNKKPGAIYIKKLPEAGTTINTIRAYVKEFQIKTGLKPDVLLIDYLDIMYPTNSKIDIGDHFIKDKLVSEEIRSFMGETNMFGATASQLNRSAIEAQEHDQSHIAGGISKINTSDNAFTILSTLSMKEKGIYKLQFLKTRSASAVGQNIELAYDPVCMRITDPPEDDFNQSFTKNASIIADKKNPAQKSVVIDDNSINIIDRIKRKTSLDL